MTCVPTLLPRLRLVLLVGWFLLCAAALPVEVWASPPPAPSPTAPNAAPGSWSCDDRMQTTTPTPDATSTPAPVVSHVGEDCSVTDWQYGPTVTLPVHEQSPVSVSLACSSSDTSSTSPSPSASPSPSPSSSVGSASPTPCSVQVSDAQVAPFIWMGGTLVMIAVAWFVVTYSRRIGRLVR